MSSVQDMAGPLLIALMLGGAMLLRGKATTPQLFTVFKN